MQCVKIVLVVAVLTVVAGAAFLYSGVYPVGADVPHQRWVYLALETLRERSIARASQDIDVPALDAPELLLAGGPDYNEMCASCHLKPGKDSSDLSIGLYPAPPNLSLGSDQGQSGDDAQSAAARQFWIIKHGIKASGMPAWGPTHDDQRIWAMVAFLQRLPQLTPQQYQILTARDEDDVHGH